MTGSWAPPGGTADSWVPPGGAPDARGHPGWGPSGSGYPWAGAGPVPGYLGDGGPPPPAYPAAYGWGLAVVPPVEEVPRPPRPAVVTVALALCYLGVAVSGLYSLGGLVLGWLGRDRLLGNGGATVLVVLLVLGLLAWLVPAVGVLLTAELSRRGVHPARIILAVLMGLSAMANLCAAGSGPDMIATLGVGGPPWYRALALGSSLLLTVLSVAIGVLLVVPAANRYFTAGPGRRFASPGRQVRSSHAR